MAWQDKFKKERILVCNLDSHNKFWAAQYDEQTNRVVVRWGRLGTKGQTQTKDFSASWEAVSFIDGKYREKARKGYTHIEQSDFDRRSIEAAIVGTQNKCYDFRWLKIIDDRVGHLEFEVADELILQDPNCNPGIRVSLETKKEYANRKSFTLVFTFDKAFDIVTAGRSSSAVPIAKSSPLYELTQKVEEALGRSLSA